MKTTQVFLLMLALLGIRFEAVGESDKVWEELLKRSQQYQTPALMSIVEKNEERFDKDVELLKKYALGGRLRAYSELFSYLPFVDTCPAEDVHNAVWDLAEANPQLFVNVLRQQPKNIQEAMKVNIINQEAEIAGRDIREGFAKTVREVKKLWEGTTSKNHRSW